MMFLDGGFDLRRFDNGFAVTVLERINIRVVVDPG
jgi:hypothetical protein